MTEPFGRQPRPVTVTLSGEKEDVEYWRRELKRRAEFKGDMTQDFAPALAPGAPVGFTIYPRAVND